MMEFILVMCLASDPTACQTFKGIGDTCQSAMYDVKTQLEPMREQLAADKRPYLVTTSCFPK